MVKRSSLHVAGAVKVVVSAATLLDVESALNSMMGAGVASGPATSTPAAGVILRNKAMMSYLDDPFSNQKKNECGVSADLHKSSVDLLNLKKRVENLINPKE